MNEFKVIDTISAYQLEFGDLFEVEGNTYRAGSVLDDGDSIQILVESLDDAIDDTDIILDADAEVYLLAYNYDDVEV